MEMKPEVLEGYVVDLACLLEPQGTPEIVRVVQTSSRDAGIRLRVRREPGEEKMETRQVREI